MEAIFAAINGIFSFIGPLSDFLWDFPINMKWYASIPILYCGAKLVFKAHEHYAKNDGTPFTGEVVGIPLEYWDSKAKK